MQCNKHLPLSKYVYVHFLEIIKYANLGRNIRWVPLVLDRLTADLCLSFHILPCHCRRMPLEYTQRIFTLAVWWPMFFLKSGVSCLQQLWQLLPAANDDIFWVTHLFDSGFMDTFAFGQTNVQIGHSCINSDCSRGQTYLAVPHSRLRNCSTVRLGTPVPNICKTSAVLSFEHHALRACPPSLPMWVCMWNDLRDIWKASCLCS